ncbi:Uncharacterized protein FKW44_004797 [Caligus rogercresseyi]|uniref:Uncharacterized protein n=1 Tax=Caligus rogercresseyi TaxID=217165 RepID=A0A7T8KBD0_CALRO|nr:Uncharacterized protein FKW44_004797 [Caligus rogercresseyi]
MVLGVVVSDGKKMLPFFLKAGEKIRKKTYYKVLSRRNVALLLAGSEPVGLRRVERIGEELDALKALIRTEWDNMSEEFLINSCKTFWRHVEAVIEAEGGHIE